MDTVIKKDENFEICVLTMQKNEDLLLEPWIQYYSNLTSYKNICILDNGSTDINVINILKKYEEKGVNVNYSYNKKEDFEDKGNILKRIAEHKYSHCDFVFFLDVDEFLCFEENRNKDDILNYLKTIPNDKQSELIIKNVQNNVLKKDIQDKYGCCDYLFYLGMDDFLCVEENCDKDIILNYLKSLPIDKKYVYKNSFTINNIYNNENYYCNQITAKAFFRGCNIKEISKLDTGFHNPKFYNAKVIEKNHFITKIGIIHFHNKPYTKKLEAAKEKMETRVDINDNQKIKSYRGKGEHLKNFLMQTEESYIKSQNDLKNKRYSTKFREKLKEYDIVIPF